MTEAVMLLSGPWDGKTVAVEANTGGFVVYERSDFLVFPMSGPIEPMYIRPITHYYKRTGPHTMMYEEELFDWQHKLPTINELPLRLP